MTFFIIESRREYPMLPLQFFKIPTFAASNVVAAAVFFALFGTTFFLSLYLQNVRGFSPVGAGVRLFPFTVMILIIAPIAGRLSDRYGSRWFMTFGTATLALGLALMTRAEPDSSYLTVILPAMIVMGAGMASTMAPMTAAVMASVPVRRAGVASAATNTSRELGGVFGIALLGAIVTSAFKRDFLAKLVGFGVPSSQAHAIVDRASSSGAASGHVPPGAPAQAIDAVKESFTHAMHVGLWVAVGFALLASVVSFVFVRSHVGEGESGAGGH